MERQEEIIIEVEVNAGESAERLAAVQARIHDVKQANKELKSEQRALNEELRLNGTITHEQAERLKEISAEMAKNNADLKELTATEKMYTAQLNTATQNDRKFGDSLVELSAQLAQLKQEYRGLTAAQRESAEGKAMLENIKNLDKTLKDADASMGDFQRNVGNYQSALLGLNGNVVKVANLFAGGFKNGIAAAGTALKGFAKTLLTTPLGWILAGVKAVTAILGKLRDAFKSNDEAGTALSAAMARLQPIVDGLNKVFSNLAEGVAKFVNVATKAVTFILTKMVPGYDKAANAARRLKIAQDELEDEERTYTVNHAKYQAQIADLQDKAAKRDKYTREQRLQFYDESIKLEERDLKEKKRIAAQRYNNALKAAAQSRHVAQLTESEYNKLSDEAKNNLAQLKAEYINVDAEMSNFSRSMQKRRQTVIKEMDGEEKAAVAAAKANANAYAEAIAEGMEKAQAELRKLEDMRNAMIEDEAERQRATISTTYSRQIEDLQKRLDTEENLTKKARESITEQQKLLREQMWKELAAVDDEQLKKANEAVLQGQQEAEKRMEEARKLTRDEYEKETLRLSNDMQQRMNEIYGNVVKASEVEMEVAQTNYDRLKNMDAETKAALFANEEQYRAAVLDAEAQIMEARTKNEEALKAQAAEVAQTMQAVTGAMSSLYEAAAGDSEAYEKFKKAMAIADAAISLAQTIAAATAVSTEGDPYTMAIRIAANVAAVTAQFAAVVKAIKAATIPSAPKFAEGGVVPGTSYTGDRVLIRANSGERVLTKEMSDNLVKMLAQGVPSWGMDYERLEQAFLRAASRVPAPVLDYSEFVAYGRKVAMEREKMMEY